MMPRYRAFLFRRRKRALQHSLKSSFEKISDFGRATPETDLQEDCSTVRARSICIYILVGSTTGLWKRRRQHFGTGHPTGVVIARATLWLATRRLPFSTPP